MLPAIDWSNKDPAVDALVNVDSCAPIKEVDITILKHTIRPTAIGAHTIRSTALGDHTIRPTAIGAPIDVQTAPLRHSEKERDGNTSTEKLVEWGVTIMMHVRCVSSCTLQPGPASTRDW